MANPDINLLGATYSGVSGVTLPTSDGETATFPWVEGSQTISQNGTYDVSRTAEAVVDVSGHDGFSPIITVTDITGGHRITITDAEGTKTVDVMDGAQGPKGDTGETGPQGETGPAGTTDYNELTNKPTIPTATSELVNDSNFMSGMTILAYGKSTWNDFITAYTTNHVVYCRASSNSNPATGSQTRMAFMAYVNNEANPTNVEFQYYRSVSSHTESQQGDQVYVYKLDKNSGWSVIVRQTFSKIVVGTGLTTSYSNGILTISLDQ